MNKVKFSKKAVYIMLTIGIIFIMTFVIETAGVFGEDTNSNKTTTEYTRYSAKVAVTLKSMRGTGKAVISWDKADKANGYRISRSATKSGPYKFLTASKSNKKLSFIDSNLIIGKTYYYKVVPYMIVDGVNKYGFYSDVSGIKVLENIKKDPEDSLMIVNKNNKMASTYVPTNLKKLDSNTTISRSIYLKINAANAFKKLYNAAKKAGYNIKGVSGYRNYSLQKYLFNSYVSSLGITAASKYSARPGTSEHQTGLALDVSCASERYALNKSFGSAAEGKWLSKNAYKYGFIIRYAKDKDSITGYQYEPWHIRYVGTKAAKNIYESNMTLEEYLGYYKHIK